MTHRVLACLLLDIQYNIQSTWNFLQVCLIFMKPMAVKENNTGMKERVLMQLITDITYEL